MSVVYKKLEEVCEILDSQRIPITAKDRKSGIYPYYGANGLQDHVADYIFDDELVLLAEDGGNFGSKDRPIAYRVSGKCWVNNHAHVLKAKSDMHIDYLCYALMFYNTDGLVNGATRKKLTQAAMRQMVIPYRCMMEQEQIVDEISRIFHLISVRNEELALLEQLVKSRFIELFEGCNYPICRLGDVCAKITDGTHKTPTYLESGVTFISAKNIVNGELDFTDVKYISDDEYAEIQKRCQTEMGDILLSKSGSLGAPVIVKTSERLGLFESLAVLKYDRSRLLPAFLCEQLKSDNVQRQFRVGTKGVAVKHLHLGVIADTNIVVPPIDVQNTFAAFVEQTDKSKLAVQKALEELEILKKSLMQQYFG